MALLGCCLPVCGLTEIQAADEPLTRFESTERHMGVPFKIILYAPDAAAANRAFEAAFAQVETLNRIFSDYDPESELSRLSQASPTRKPVPLSEPLWTVLERSQAIAERTGGAFDVTVGPYVRLWRRARRSREMPPADRMAEAKAAVGYRYLELEPVLRAARLLKPNMRLDLGGIAMGYAVDETIKLLRARGLTRALVDASGDIAVSEPPPGKQGWEIEAAPLSDDGTPSRRVLLRNAAITTAGDAFQHVDIAGKRYSHIVDPRTGLGTTDSLGVTVIASDCITADGLDTAICVLGVDAGLKLLRDTPGAEAFLVRPSPNGVETFESPGFAKSVVSENR